MHRRPLHPRKYSWYLFLLQAERPQGRNDYVNKKNSSYTIGNRFRDLPAGSTVPQLSAPPRAPHTDYSKGY
jgi:hypothetical protein